MFSRSPRADESNRSEFFCEIDDVSINLSRQKKTLGGGGGDSARGVLDVNVSLRVS